MTGNALEIINWLYKQKEDVKYDIEVHKEKRSLNANSYCWAMIGKLAEKLNITKEEIYKDFIKHKGVYRIITLNTEAVPTFIKIWSEKGLGWICETSETNINGLTDVIAYYGTSSYNTKQMASFIDYVVYECRNQGIETKTDEEVISLLESWHQR